jgi:predicted Zn-dependent protease
MSWSVRRLSLAALLSIAMPWQARAYFADLAEDARQAKEAMLAQRYREAAGIYRRMAAQMPGEPGIRFNLALALHQAGEMMESTRILESIRASQRNNPRYWFLLGEGYLNLGTPEKAVSPLEEAARLEPANPDAGLELASALLESGQFTKSEEHFRAFSQTRPDAPEIWAGLALSQLGLGRPREAENSRARLAALPESPEKHEMLARIDLRTGQKALAVQDLQNAARLSPSNPQIQSMLARAFIANRQFEEAIVLLKPLLARAPDNSGWLFDLGDALLQTGKLEEAIPVLRRTVEISPGLLPAQAKLGEALLSSGSAQEAAGHLEAAALMDRDGSIHFQLATAYRRIGRQELADKAMARRAEIQKSIQHSDR